jgi:hypothetical protein
LDEEEVLGKLYELENGEDVDDEWEISDRGCIWCDLMWEM